MKQIVVVVAALLLSGCAIGKKDVVIHPLQDDFFQVPVQSKIIYPDGTEKVATKSGYFMSGYYFNYVMEVKAEK